MDITAFRHETVTPSDSVELPADVVAIVVVGTGDVSMTDRFNTTIVYPSLPAYTTFENFIPLRINATGTTSTDIVMWRSNEEAS